MTITVSAQDSVYRSDITAAKRYRCSDLKFNVRFADVMELDPKANKLRINFQKFNQVTALKKANLQAHARWTLLKKAVVSPKQERSVAEFCF